MISNTSIVIVTDDAIYKEGINNSPYFWYVDSLIFSNGGLNQRARDGSIRAVDKAPKTLGKDHPDIRVMKDKELYYSPNPGGSPATALVDWVTDGKMDKFLNNDVDLPPRYKEDPFSAKLVPRSLRFLIKPTENEKGKFDDAKKNDTAFLFYVMWLQQTNRPSVTKPVFFIYVSAEAKKEIDEELDSNCE